MSETIWNVRADQPYQIETQAAQDLADPRKNANSGFALLNLLGGRAQHNLDRANYEDQIGQQRDFAYQKLAATIADNNAQRAITVMQNENPGAINFAANNPATAGLFRNMDPNAANLFADWSSRKAASVIAENLGKAAQGSLAGGVQMPPSYLSGILPGNPAMTLADPPLVAAAKIRAASSGGGGSGGISTSIQLPISPDGSSTATVRYRNGLPPGIEMGPGGLPRLKPVDMSNPTPVTTSSTSPESSAPPSNTTTPATTQAPAQTGTRSANQGERETIVKAIESAAKSMPPAMYNAIRGGGNGIQIDANDKVVVIGKDGKPYKLTP